MEVNKINLTRIVYLFFLTTIHFALHYYISYIFVSTGTRTLDSVEWFEIYIQNFQGGKFDCPTTIHFVLLGNLFLAPPLLGLLSSLCSPVA